MIRYKINCRGCQESKKNPNFRKRVYTAAFKREDGDETLKQIAEEFGHSYPSLYNHVKKHLTESRYNADEAKAVRTAKKVATIQAKVNKDMEVGFERGEMTVTDEYELSLNGYLSQGKAILDSGNMKITEKGFLTAIKIKSDIQAKKRGQDIEIMKAVYSFSSGNQAAIKEKAEKAKEQIDGRDISTSGDAEGANSGQGRPDSVYRALAGDATS